MDFKSLFLQEKYFLITLFIVSFLLRAFFFAQYTRYEDHAWLAFDSEQYHIIAKNIAYKKGISNADGTPNFYRLPGYPLFLAALYKLFSGSSEKALWVQVILASLIPLLMSLLGIVFLPQVLFARCLGVAAALHPGLILYAGILSTESLFLLFFVLFLILFFSSLFNSKQKYTPETGALEHPEMSSPTRSGIQKKMTSFFSAGFVLGVASLIRAVGHYLLVVAVFVILISSLQRPEKFKAMASITAGWLLVVSWWLIRNYLLAGAIFFHTLPGLHFLQYSAVYTIMDQQHCDYFQAKKVAFQAWDTTVKMQELKLGRKLSEHERFSIAERLAISFLLSNPMLSLKNACKQLARTCGTLYSTVLLYVPAGTIYGDDASVWFKMKLYLMPRTLQPWLLVPFIYWELLFSLFLLIGCGLFGFQMFYDAYFRRLALLTVCFVVVLIGITLAYGCARLRMPVEPFLLIYATLGCLKTITTD